MERRVRHPVLTAVADGVTAIDTDMTGEPELNAVYLVDALEPALVEAGPGADHDVIVEALDRSGLGNGDLAHIVVTHVHLDHAGGAGALARRFPRARLWVHERGAPHLADPTRLVASTARTYGETRMIAFFGPTTPVPADRLISVDDGDRIPLGDRELEVVFTPGHASHHVALRETATGAVFTGEAIGSHLPWADCYRPALPPPEVDVEQALASVERIRSLEPSVLLTSHFGAVVRPADGCERAADRIRAWSETVRRSLSRTPGTPLEVVTDRLRSQAATEFLADSGRPLEPPETDRYDALGSIGMNAAGLSRYWRKRWEREASTGET